MATNALRMISKYTRFQRITKNVCKITHSIFAERKIIIRRITYITPNARNVTVHIFDSNERLVSTWREQTPDRRVRVNFRRRADQDRNASRINRRRPNQNQLF